MANKLGLYNGALFHLGERNLATVTDAVEPRYALDVVYDAALAYALEQGYWKFSMRTTQLDYTTAVTPAFGYQYPFEKPADLVKLYQMSADEYFNVPLTEVAAESDYWFANVQQIYVGYVSNDSAYGLDLSKWTPAFTLFVELHLAWRIAPRVAPSVDRDKLLRDTKLALNDALTKDAIQGPTKFFPVSAWVGSRRGGYARRERGNRGQLIG